MSTRKKIAFICGRDTKFILPIQQALSVRYDVRSFFFEENVDLNAIQEALDWADVAWFEWCDQILVRSSRVLSRSSRVVCRLHSYEAFTDMPKQVNWSFVDHLVFVAPHLQEIFRGTVSTGTPSSVIFNGVDTSAYTFRRRHPSFEMAYVGYINYKKNPEMLIQVLARLVEQDRRYRLHVAGTYQDLRYALYFEKMVRELGLERNFIFHGWVADLDRWLEDKDYILSTSLLESFGMNIVEAMAKGLKPVVHNWVGAEFLYPREMLFNTIDEAVEQITSGSFDSTAYRSFVEANYTLDRQIDSITRLIESLAPQP